MTFKMLLQRLWQNLHRLSHSPSRPDHPTLGCPKHGQAPSRGPRSSFGSWRLGLHSVSFCFWSAGLLLMTQLLGIHWMQSSIPPMSPRVKGQAQKTLHERSAPQRKATNGTWRTSSPMCGHGPPGRCHLLPACNALSINFPRCWPGQVVLVSRFAGVRRPSGCRIRLDWICLIRRGVVLEHLDRLSGPSHDGSAIFEDAMVTLFGKGRTSC